VKLLAVDFEVIERGGINRIVEGLKYGLESAGCQFDYYWASASGKLRSISPDAPTMVNDRYFRLPARQLSYAKKDSARNFSKLLRQYDVLLMIQASPHDIKGKQGDMSWMMLYEVAAELGKPIIVIIHDNLWEKYYPWYRQVSDMVKLHLFTCYQAKYASLSRLPGNFVFLPTPLDVRQAGLYSEEKKDALCWLPQWKKWKGIYSLLEAMPSIRFPVDLYNSGIEYHNVRQDSTGIWKRVIGLNHVNKTRGKGNPEHQYWGSLLPDEIPKVYKNHAASIDLSGSIGERFDGQTSCVMLEAMLYGCTSVVHQVVDQHRWSPLAGQEVVWTVPSEPDGIADKVNEILRKPKTRARLASRALDFVVEYSDARKHAHMLLDYLGADLPKTDSRPVFYDYVCEDPIPVHDPTVYELKPYVSKHAPKPVVEEPEEPIIHAVPLELVEPAIQMVQRMNGKDPRWMQFVTRVARAWVEIFDDSPYET
jgi:glycosyltransferase involved in cell wall biosynthesis